VTETILRSQKAACSRQKAASRGRILVLCLLPTAYCLLFFSTALAQVGDFEGRRVAVVDVMFEGTPADPDDQAELQTTLKITSNSNYSAVLVRQSLADLMATNRVASARVEITEVDPGAGRNGAIRVRFVVKRQIVIAGVTLRIGPATG